MSTPSTATAILPQPHHHYGFPHHQDFHTRDLRGPGFGSNPIVNGPSRLGSSSQYNFPTNTTPQASASTTRQTESTPRNGQRHASNVTLSETSTRMSSRKRARGPDWTEFYKNGLPREVIVIDDDSPPPPARVPPQAFGSQRANLIERTQGSKRSIADIEVEQPASKKRKTGVSNGHDSKPQPAGYSAARTSGYGDSHSASTRSTDRTTSAFHTTAATSLGSHYSQNGAPANAYKPNDDVEIVGEKRKRTRKAVADEAKKRDIEAQGFAYNTYVPPPKPPIKAKDVLVPTALDTSPYKHQKVDDDDGHYVVVPDTHITDRYCVTKLLGQGTFGKVVEAIDKRRRSKVAIKIIRSVQKYRDASRIELRVLSTLNSNDKENRNKCIHLRDCFDFRNHICIVTDLLGMSVFDFLKSNSFVPFPSSQIQSFARQLLTSVAFLHDLNLIHTDLKPENILLVQNHYQTFTYNRQVPSSTTTSTRVAKNRKVLLDTDIRLIDFGSATFDDEYHSSVVSTRHYRAPEIILGLGWSYPCDIWSIGCILVEFFTGDALFQTHDNLEHLAMMESVCGGKIEPRLIRQIVQGGRGSSQNSAAKYFQGTRKLDYPNKETTRASKKYVSAMKDLNDIIPPNAQNKFNDQFLDLLRRIFLYDPAKRITAKEALKHPWFRESIIDDGTEATKIRIEREQEGSLQTRGY